MGGSSTELHHCRKVSFSVLMPLPYPLALEVLFPMGASLEAGVLIGTTSFTPLTPFMMV